LEATLHHQFLIGALALHEEQQTKLHNLQVTKNTIKREKHQEAKYGSFNMFIIVNHPLPSLTLTFSASHIQHSSHPFV
jgi:hypothetical protein